MLPATSTNTAESDFRALTLVKEPKELVPRSARCLDDLMQRAFREIAGVHRHDDSMTVSGDAERPDGFSDWPRSSLPSYVRRVARTWTGPHHLREPSTSTTWSQ